MKVISESYVLAGQLAGARVILEQGVCTNSGADLNDLKQYETGRVDLIPVPRSGGLIAKPLDGQTIKTRTIAHESIGTFANCMQLEKTEVRQLAPKQPIGPLRGKIIMAYQRTWVQLTP